MLPLILLLFGSLAVAVRAQSSSYAFASTTPFYYSTYTSATTRPIVFNAPPPVSSQAYYTSPGVVLTGNASALMYSAQGYGVERNIVGTIYLKQYTETLSNGSTIRYVNITGHVISVFPGNNFHGFHIHENAASVENDGCSGLGKHFNPRHVDHGPQTGNVTTRHVGDLGNLRSDSSGKARIALVDYVLQVGSSDKTFDVVGRSIAIHQGNDDLGIGGSVESLQTGNSGSVIACGNILLYRPPTSSSVRIKANFLFTLLSISWITFRRIF